MEQAPRETKDGNRNLKMSHVLLWGVTSEDDYRSTAGSQPLRALISPKAFIVPPPRQILSSRTETFRL
ncbi:unnamed protein product [Dovyalis caffra]|uniref:Uncharacterized protein n=1 Tax=Dovyalis caffra TaxID=77055 RepID=A0AAV1R3W3_9ROSI|nr:unnamed protein product [Dovyalis caffra]